MINIEQIRARKNKIVVIGNHPALIQSILDFDYLSGKSQPSLIAVVTGKRGYTKFFFGKEEVLFPTFISVKSVPLPSDSTNWFFNISSGRRTLPSTLELLDFNYAGGVLFAENVPELHAHSILRTVEGSRYSPLILGPASVGLLVPTALKLGPIGGITPLQVEESGIIKPGHIAVLSASGGMTNELISVAALAGHHLSFALSFGGDRFPILSPSQAFLLAEADPATTAVLYYGELGGLDEYELVKLKEEGKFTKKVIAHIAGTVADLFPESPQFGHAKAKAASVKDSALSKRKALREAGFNVTDSFSAFVAEVGQL